MRFLCLHGYATSAEVLEEQMQPIIAQLPSDWEYEFLNAEMEPSELMLPSLDQAPKPNYSWYNLPFFEDVDRAYRRITSFIELEGPFDGVWGFSQGGSMAALLLLNNHAETGGSSFPFKMGIFVSAFLPHSFSSGLITWDFSEGEKLLATHVHGESCESSCGKDVDWRTDPRSSIDFDILAENQQKIAFPVHLLLKHRPSGSFEKMTIPSVHVRGLKDTYHFVDDSVLALFDSDTSRNMTHRGGHHFPRFSEELVRFAEMIIETACSIT
ncbi:hypothetical protein JX265_003259 [Neoarthrinium moseri]|uniref:Serine hydrolase domain-containing protein n=1 Tax=Neoarthrinium moseri TaxID=1658444 RepID=A0A9P9WTX8_9PEZI|nr:hypothetical protein JX266_002314 [Neoarthrinium moseri]KAI1879082.1 hypothetical protein JX265_003259 [Neoarthrinium moseri]